MLARGLGAVGLRLDLHARRGRADAARGQHALAFDLDHADAAVAVRPIAGLGRVAQMRDASIADVALRATCAKIVSPASARCRPRVAVERRTACCRRSSFDLLDHQCRAASSAHRGNISARTAADSAPPGRGRRSRRRASRRTVRRAAPGPTARFSISLTAFSVPTRQGVHWPQLSSSKNFIRLSATAFMSSLSDRITTAWEPTKQPYFSSVPKSSGIVRHRRRQDAARGAARQIGLEGVAVRHAAAILLDQFARRDAGRRELDAGLLHAARHREAAEALALVAALRRRTSSAPFSTMSRTQNSVSTFCSSVGRPNRPTCAT